MPSHPKQLSLSDILSVFSLPPLYHKERSFSIGNRVAKKQLPTMKNTDGIISRFYVLPVESVSK